MKKLVLIFLIFYINVQANDKNCQFELKHTNKNGEMLYFLLNEKCLKNQAFIKNLIEREILTYIESNNLFKPKPHPLVKHHTLYVFLSDNNEALQKERCVIEICFVDDYDMQNKFQRDTLVFRAEHLIANYTRYPEGEFFEFYPNKKDNYSSPNYNQLKNLY